MTNSSWAAASISEVGSSRISTSAQQASARASRQRWFSPPLKAKGYERRMRAGSANCRRASSSSSSTFADAAAFADLPADGQDRVEAGRGVLRGIKYLATADAVPGPRAESNSRPRKNTPAAADAQAAGQEAGQGSGQHGLAGAALPEQHRDLAGRDLQVDAAQQRQRPRRRCLFDPETLRPAACRQRQRRRPTFNPSWRRWLRSRPRPRAAAR